VTPWQSRGAIALGLIGLWLFACTEHLVVRPEGEFSWEPPSRMAWPVQGAVLSAFGDPARPSHQGIDLAAQGGEPVAAAMLGRVEFQGEIAGYGNVIVLSHADHLSTVYAHLGTAQVQEGDTVSRGQTIATVGKDGYLHYEIRSAKEAVDPAKYYAIAPQPLVRGSAEAKQKVAHEPSGVGMLGGIDEGVVNAPTPRPEPTYEPPPPTPEPSATPEPTPKPTRTPKSRREPALRETPVAEASPYPEPTPSRGESQSFALTMAVIGANLFYVPAKLGYAAAGGLIGGVALVLAHDTTVANDIWGPTLGGDYVVTAEHLRGNAPLHFAGGD